MAEKEVDPVFYFNWSKMYQEALVSNYEREEKVE